MHNANTPIHKFTQLTAGLVLAFCTTAVFAATNECHVVKKVAFPEQKMTAVVATGDLEACSMGSYAVRLYTSDNAQPGDDTTFFVQGTLQARDGQVSDVFSTALNNNKRPVLVVVTESAGSGSSKSAAAFAVDKRQIRRIAAVEDLAGNSSQAQIVQALKQKANRGQQKKMR